MRCRRFLSFWLGAMVICFMVVKPCPGQHRDYYISGKIVDSEDQPIPKVEILLRDINTSRSYSIHTNKKGKFKFAGLPSGIYQVTMTKEGYRTKTDEWKFDIKQDRMQKVDLETIKMITEKRLKEIELTNRVKKDFEKATKKINEKDFAGALSILETILQEKPDDENARYFSGICYYKQDKIPEAIAAFTKVSSLNPSFAGAYLHLGICYQKQNELEKAFGFYQQALKLEPENLISLFNSGLILYKLERYPEALTYFEKALVSKPDDSEILEFTGLCYIQIENYKKALEYLEKAKKNSVDQDKIKSLDELIKSLKGQTK